jgi:hypothetical protein
MAAVPFIIVIKNNAFSFASSLNLTAWDWESFSINFSRLLNGNSLVSSTVQRYGQNHVTPNLAPSNAAFCGFLMMSL